LIGVSRITRPLATQFNATPPAMQRLVRPVSRWMYLTILSTTSSHTFCTEAAMSNSRSVIQLSGFRGGPPKNSLNAPLVMVRP
jgi:hypothetical protein